MIQEPQSGSAGTSRECHQLLFPNPGTETLSDAATDQKLQLTRYSGQGGDGQDVTAVSITADIVCHRHNGVGF